MIWADLPTDRHSPADALVVLVAESLTTRTYNVLERAEPPARTLRDIASRSAREWMFEPNCGRRTVAELREILAAHGLRFRDD